MLDESLVVTYANPAAETLLAHGAQAPDRRARSTRRCRGNDEFVRAPRAARVDARGGLQRQRPAARGRAATRAPALRRSRPIETAGEARAGARVPRARAAAARSRARRASLEQQQANRELIRNLAHEIKNPLGGLRGAAQLLERELDRPGAARVHAGDHQGGRPPAVADEPPAHAAPRAARRAAQHPRGARARAHAAARGVPRHSRSSATTTRACPS